jgi:hypothetical protein
MVRYQCPRCHEITHRDRPTAYCAICAGPLSEHDVLPERQPPEQPVASLADLLAVRDMYSMGG